MSRPRDNIGGKFLGAAPHANRKVFFEASPISYATADKNSTRFLLVHGTHDDIVDPATQSTAFLNALKQAGFFARTVVIPGAGHFFVTDPVDDTSFGGGAPFPTSSFSSCACTSALLQSPKRDLRARRNVACPSDARAYRPISRPSRRRTSPPYPTSLFPLT